MAGNERRFNEHYNQDVLNSLTAPITVLQPDGTIVAANEAWRRLMAHNNAPDFGNTGANYFAVIRAAAAGASAYAADIETGLRAVSSGQLSQFEKECPCHQLYQECWVLVRAAPFKGQAGAVVVSHTDITRLKQAELAQQVNQSHFRSLAENSPDIIYILDLNIPAAVYFNRSNLLGYSLEELNRPGSIMHAIHPEDVAQVAVHWQRLKQGQPVEPVEYRLQTKHGGWEWLQSRETILNRNEDGSTAQLLVTLTLITQRKHTEAALGESQEKFRLIAENTSDGIVVFEGQKITYASPAYNKLMGLDIQGQNGIGPAEIMRLIHPEDRDRIQRDIKAATARQQPALVYSYRKLTAAGVIWREDHARFIYDEQGNHCKSYVVCRDVTERKQAEQNLRQRNRELEFLNRVGQTLVSTLDLEQMLAEVLEQARQLLGVFSCSAWLLEPGTDKLVCLQAADPYRHLLHGWKLKLGQGLVGWSVSMGQSALTSDTRADPRHFRDVDRQVGVEMRSIISTPLRVKQQVIGALAAVDTAVNRFTPSDLSLLESLAATMAIAIENARLFDREQQQRQAAEQALREMQLLHHISTILAHTGNMQVAIEQALGEYLKAIRLEQGGIALFDPEKQVGILYALYRHGRPQPPNLPIKILSPVYQKLIESQQPVTIFNAATDPLLANNQELTALHGIKSILFIPLRVRGQVVGALGADATNQYRHFSEREISLGQAVADQLAGAIDRIRLDEEQRRLTAVVEQAAETIIITDPPGNIVYANPYFETSSGYSVAEVLGQNPSITQSGQQDMAFYQELWDTISAGKIWHGTIINQRKDGRPYHEEASIFPIKNSAGEIINYAAVKRDITERVQAEEQLRLLAAAIESTAEGIIITDSRLDWPGPQIVFVNQGMCRMSGYSREELLGRQPCIFYGPASSQAASAALKAAVSQGQAFWDKSINYRKDGSTYQAIWHISPIYNASAQITHYMALVQDVTEVQKLEAQLRQSQKIEAIGRLAGGVAHDFNNILTIIIGYADFLLMHHPDETDPLHHDVSAIRRAAERAAGLTRQLLAFSRRQTLHPQHIDLNDLVANLEKMLNRLLRKNIELKTRLAPQLEPIYADPGQIEQVIVNLVVNARDAMPDGGIITIATDAIHLEKPVGLCNGNDFEAGPHIRLTVSDTGVGIPAAVLERIFEPFFTTKPAGQGTGLGLSMVHGIVGQSKGCLEVESNAGQCASFKVYLPQSKRLKLRKKQKQPDDLQPGTETILVVEGEAEVRGVTIQALEQYGYTVLAAASGEEAHRVAAEYQGIIHLLLTDVVLPGNMNGITLAQYLTVQRPDIKTVFMSGVAGDFDLLPDNLSPVHILQKPFTPAGLVMQVQAAL